MTQNVYPLFGRNRILKKEFLQSMRDYSYGFMRLEFERYPNGFLQGCNVLVTPEKIGINKGLVKYEDFIYLLAEPLMIPYMHTGEFQYLKLRLGREQMSEDYVNYTEELILDEEMDCIEGDLEVCRFKLKKGFYLRNEYMDFYDIETEYDTVNLVGAQWASIGGAALSPDITLRFARELLKCRSKDTWDIQFCVLCTSSATAVSRETLEAYVRTRLDLDDEEILDNKRIFDDLEWILRANREGIDPRREKKIKKRHIIIVD